MIQAYNNSGEYGFQGSEAVDLTVGDNFVHLNTQLSALTRAKRLNITLLVNKNKGESN